MSLRDNPPRPLATRVAPSYPRALALASALMLGGCGIYGPSYNTAGDIAIPFDAEVDTAPETLDFETSGADAAPFKPDTGRPEDTGPDQGEAAPPDGAPEASDATDDAPSADGAAEATQDAAADADDAIEGG